MTKKKNKFYFNIKLNQGHFEPQATIPKFSPKKIENEPTSKQKIAQKMGYEGKKRFRLRRKPCNSNNTIKNNLLPSYSS